MSWKKATYLAAVLSIGLLGRALPMARAADAATTRADAGEGEKIVSPQDPKVFLTGEELATAYKQKQYQLVVREIFRIQQNKLALEAHNPFSMYLLLGEAQLHLRNTPRAIDAYKEALKAAPDEDTAAVMNATILLFKRQTNLTYVPRTADKINLETTRVAKPRAIDLQDVSLRPEAFKALFRDESATVLPQLKSALNATSLGDIAAAGKAMTDLAMLETAADGNTKTVDEQRQKLAQHALELMLKAQATDKTTISDIKIKANTAIMSSVPVLDSTGHTHLESQYVKQGIMADDGKTLKAIVAKAPMYQKAAKELTAILHQDERVFSPATDGANDVADAATTVLTASYTLTTTVTGAGQTIVTTRP